MHAYYFHYSNLFATRGRQLRPNRQPCREVVSQQCPIAHINEQYEANAANRWVQLIKSITRKENDFMNSLCRPIYAEAIASPSPKVEIQLK